MAPGGLVLPPVALFLIPELCQQGWVFRVILGMLKPETVGSVYKYPGVLA